MNLFFISTLIISLVGLIYVYQGFLNNIVVAGILCIASLPIKLFISRFIRFNLIASLLTTIIFLSCFILPIIFIILNTLQQIRGIDFYAMVDLIPRIINNIVSYVENSPLSKYIDLNTFNIDQNINKLKLFINTNMSDLINLSLKFGRIGFNVGLSYVWDFTFIILFLYLFYYYANHIKEYCLNIAPFDRKDSEEIFKEVTGVIKLVFYGSLISMLLQGISFGIYMYFLGFNSTIFFIIYAFASLIPLVGGAIIWLPMCIYLLMRGEIMEAIFLGLYCAVFIGIIIDNFIKPLIIGWLNRRFNFRVKINDILIFISIIAGLSSLGLFGIIIGPALSAFCISLLRLFTKLRGLSHE